MYSAKVIEKIDNGKGYWQYLLIGIFDADGKKVGEYKRNYSSMYDTFFPFKQGEQWFALYSKDYTATRVMKLPECEDIAGEDEASSGFCPTGFYVPQVDEDSERNADEIGELSGTFGFVCGCHWGDDTSWKIQYLDLSRIKEGIFSRDARFGYIEMPDTVKNLAECFSFRFFTPEQPQIQITLPTPFFITGKDYELHNRLEKEKGDAFWAIRKAEAASIEKLTGLKVDGWMMGSKPVVKKEDGIEYIIHWDGKEEIVFQNREEWIKSQKQ